jgi:DUF3037 family protein
MKATYTYSVLRYVHDVLTGEFVNVGALLYSPDAAFLKARCITSYARLSQFYGSVDGRSVLHVLRYVERAAGELANRLFTNLRFEELPKDARSCANLLIPPDDSAIQFGELGIGLTDNPEEALATIFERFVTRYTQHPAKSTRMDDEILPILKHSLAKRRVFVEPKVIVTPNYEHEFPIAWKNGMWKACDAVSFDLSQSSDILEKANRWLGRAHTLRESKEKFKLILFLGQPRHNELWGAYQKAENILNTMPKPFELVRENEASAFADEVERDQKDQLA